ncbi:MAG TPA: PIN domain-containing protein [Candidatus Limnocylindrales bacterium]
MTERTFVDTNVWVYAVDAADAAKRALAIAMLRPSAESDFVVSTQVLIEFYVVVTRKLASPLAPEAAQAMVDEMARLPVVPTDAQLVLAAMAGSREWGISLWDALIIRAAEASGCSLVLSEDMSQGGRYGSVRVENPFLADA